MDVKASWFVRKFCNSSNDDWLVHLWMDMINGEYSFFKPLMKYLLHLASLIFSLRSAQRFLIFKKYSAIVRLPSTVDASSFSSNYNRATFFLEKSFSSVSHTSFGVSRSLMHMILGSFSRFTCAKRKKKTVDRNLHFSASPMRG